MGPLKKRLEKSEIAAVRLKPVGRTQACDITTGDHAAISAREKAAEAIREKVGFCAAMAHHRAGLRRPANAILPAMRASAPPSSSKRDAETVCRRSVRVAVTAAARKLVKLKPAKRNAKLEKEAALAQRGDTAVPARTVITAVSSKSPSAILT